MVVTAQVDGVVFIVIKVQDKRHLFDRTGTVFDSAAYHRALDGASLEHDLLRLIMVELRKKLRRACFHRRTDQIGHRLPSLAVSCVCCEKLYLLE